MTKDGHAVAVLSGELTVEQRISVLDRFRAGLEKVLITTNVLARGIYLLLSTYSLHFYKNYEGTNLDNLYNFTKYCKSI